jgi:hypothetical protein
MSNLIRRKTIKNARRHGVHITPAVRAANKEEDGIPVQSLSQAYRRYWSAVNSYGTLRNESLYYLSLDKETG